MGWLRSFTCFPVPWFACSVAGETPGTAPVGVVGEREDVLDPLGPIRPGLGKDFQGAAEIGEPSVVGQATGPVDAIQGGGHFNKATADGEELAVEDFGGRKWGFHRNLVVRGDVPRQKLRGGPLPV